MHDYLLWTLSHKTHHRRLDCGNFFFRFFSFSSNTLNVAWVHLFWQIICFAVEMNFLEFSISICLWFPWIHTNLFARIFPTNSRFASFGHLFLFALHSIPLSLKLWNWYENKLAMGSKHSDAITIESYEQNILLTATFSVATTITTTQSV